MEDENDRTLQDDLSDIMAAAIDCAEEVIAPHAIDCETDSSISFPLDGNVRHLSADAPQEALSAAALLRGCHRLVAAKSDGDLEAAVQTAFLIGLIANNVWVTAKVGKGRSLEDVLKSFLSGGRRVALSNEEVGKAKILFAKFVDNGATNNAAVMKVMKELSAGRQSPVKKSTVERAVGIRA